MLPIVHFLLRKKSIVTNIIYLYKSSSGIKEQEQLIMNIIWSIILKHNKDIEFSHKN